jgi:hypothetical protein
MNIDNAKYDADMQSMNSLLQSFQERVAARDATINECREMLKEIEWLERPNPSANRCPVCGWWSGYPPEHDEDCKLKALLEKLG